MFKSFSETSRLYAQNYSVIEAVEAEFQRNVDAFLDNVYEKIQSATAGKSQERITRGRGGRYWWIRRPDEEDCPYLYLSGSEPGIVHPGEVELHVWADKASPEQLSALRAVGTRPEFSAICKVPKGKPGPYSLFTATIKYGEEDAVEQVSSVTAELLLALNEAYERASRSAGPSAA